MPLNTVTVSGFLCLPNGETFPNGKVTFCLTRPSNDSGYMLPPEEVIVDIGVDGSFSVELWPNSRYDFPTSYQVTAYEYFPQLSDYGNAYDFGKIVVPETDVNISDILPVFVPTRNTYVLHRGDSMLLPVVMLDGNNVPVDISDSSVSCILYLGGLSINLGASKIPETKGMVQISMTANQSASLGLATYQMSIIMSALGRVSSVRANIKVI